MGLISIQLASQPPSRLTDPNLIRGVVIGGVAATVLIAVIAAIVWKRKYTEGKH